jgi:hypothetical protein
MKRWVIPVLFSILTSWPAVSVAEDATFDSGRATRFTIPLITIPFGSSQDSDTAKEKEIAPKMGEKDSEAKKEEEKQAILDKKVDDAIKRAWGRETTESPDSQK